jgi:hypothetical protein
MIREPAKAETVSREQRSVCMMKRLVYTKICSQTERKCIDLSISCRWRVISRLVVYRRTTRYWESKYFEGEAKCSLPGFWLDGNYWTELRNRRSSSRAVIRTRVAGWYVVNSAQPTELSTFNFYNYLHGTESFLRSQQVLSYSRNSSHFMEPEGSSPHSQQPSTCPYPEPDRSSLCPHPAHFSKIHFNIIFPSTPRSSKWSASLRFPH